MNILIIAYYTAKKYLRNILLILFFVFGTIGIIYLTASEDTAGFEQLDKSYREKAGFYIEDQGSYSKQFYEFINSKELKKIIDFKKVNSYHEGINQIKKGRIDSFVYIGKRFSEAALNKKKAAITVKSANKVSVLKVAVESFVNYNNSVDAAINTRDMLKNTVAARNLKNHVIDTTGKAPGVRDSGSISVMLIMMFYGGLFSSYSLIYDSNKKTNLRLRTAPISYIENISGKILGSVAVMVIFEVVIVAFTKLFLNVPWRGNPIITFVPLILFSIIASSLGIIAASISKNIYICGLSMFAVNFLLAYSVQAQAYDPSISNAFDLVMAISPHNYTYRAIIGNAFSQTSYNTGASILVLALSALVLVLISFAAGRRRMA